MTKEHKIAQRLRWRRLSHLPIQGLRAAKVFWRAIEAPPKTDRRPYFGIRRQYRGHYHGDNDPVMERRSPSVADGFCFIEWQGWMWRVRIP